MPDVNGLEACYLLRQHYGEDLRICMMTAAHDPETVKRAAEMGADGWLTKPIHRVNLLALVGLAKRPLPERRAATVPAVQKPARQATAKGARVPVVDGDGDLLGDRKLGLRVAG